MNTWPIPFFVEADNQGDVETMLGDEEIALEYEPDKSDTTSWIVIQVLPMTAYSMEK